LAQHGQLGLFPSNTAAPVIFNLGMGVDSVAMLIGLWRRAARPDLLIFANTGGEKPDTIPYLGVINPWLTEVSFPQVTVVTRLVGRAVEWHGCTLRQILSQSFFALPGDRRNTICRRRGLAQTVQE
jgi:hypothetical protein